MPKGEQPKLLLICGLPGAGKTTLAKKLAKQQRAIRFCPDEWMQDLGISLWDEPFRSKLEERFWLLSQELIRQSQSVILEYGFWAKAERYEKLRAIRSLGEKIELHFLDVTTSLLKSRLERRGMEGDDVLANKIAAYAKLLERPTEDELRLYDYHKIYTANPRQ